MQGLILFCALGGELLIRYRVRARSRAGRHRLSLAAGVINNSIVVVVLASARRLRHAASLRGARRAAGGAVGRAEPRCRGDDAGRRRHGLLGGAAHPARCRLAVLVAALAGRAMALIHAFLVITLRANQIVSGLALTIFAGAAGLSSYLGNDLNLADQPAKHAFDSFLPPCWRTAPSSGRSSSTSPRSSMRRGCASCSSRSTSTARASA